MADVIENKVAKSGLITLDLEEIKPNWNIVGFDMAQVLWEGIALKEKEYRSFIQENNWSQYQDKAVYIYCSADAIIPTWAYMLLAKALQEYAQMSVIGDKRDLELRLWRELVQGINLDAYNDQRVILKGCSKEDIPDSIYHELSTLLLPKVKTLMFGEPCSTVPIYKKK